MQHVTLFGLVCLLGLTQTSWAIKCYTCNNLKDEKCNDPSTSPQFIVECSADLANKAMKAFEDTANKVNQFLSGTLGIDTKEIKTTEIKLSCMKQVVEVEGKSTINRGCAIGSEEDFCGAAAKAVGSSRSKQSYCGTCENDLCNAATSVHTITGFFLASFAIFMSRVF